MNGVNAVSYLSRSLAVLAVAASLAVPTAHAETLVVPGPRNMVPLDVASVTTGGTAVTALTAGHRTAGGWIYNPTGAAADLCINEMGTATGTVSAGSTVCIAAGATLLLTPSNAPVSVISSDSAHAFAGMGWNS
jgi:hypothetical protein